MLYYFLATLGGICVATQVGVNGQLSKIVGNALNATLISFVIGAVSMVPVVFLSGKSAGLQQIPTVMSNTPWLLVGGVLGAIYVTTNVASAPQIGPALTICLIIMGQLIGGLAIEHFGWLGFPENPITLQKVIGLILMVSGVVLIKFKIFSS